MLKFTRLKTITAVAAVLSLFVFYSLPVYALPFRDISGHWAGSSIVHLAGMQIVSGYDGRFNPDAGVTRAEFAAMIVKALGLADQALVVKGSDTGYRDVSSGHWASGFVIIARELGIISGYPDGTFKPSAMIRRDEITSVLVRALKLGPDGYLEDPRSGFRDGGAIPAWALDAVKTACSYKLVSGFPDGTFGPQKNATRGETAALIEKVLDLLGAGFTFYGRIQNIDDYSRLVTLDIQGQVESFAYRPAVNVKTGGGFSTIDKLKAGSKAFVVLDNEGYITYIQTTEQDFPMDNQPALSDYFSARALVYGTSGVAKQEEGRVGALIAAQRGLVRQVAQKIQMQGGKIKFISSDIDFISAEVSPSLFQQLKADPSVLGVAIDRPVKIKGLSAGGDEQAPAFNETNPGISLNVTKEAIKAPEFVRVTHSDGKNQIIAVIDTGVDAGHPDLQQTSDGKRKILEWRDFTGEGDIDTSSVTTQSGKTITLADGQYTLGDSISSLSGRIHYGYLREVDIVDAKGKSFDLNYNGSASDIFAVVLVDSTVRGAYDTVYVDTDNDRDFSDEVALHPFAEKPTYAAFTGNNGKDKLNIVLTVIEPGGDKVNFGFDGNDHGTHVAGTAAANGKIKGVAPGARIMALKVLDTAGYGDLSTIVEAMTYAATHGAKIINLSLGLPVSDYNGTGALSTVLNTLTDKYGVIFVVAAGNDGPGLTTVATPGDATAALSVGAFVSPEMWKTDYGWDVPNENLWFFSSAGPRKDGAVSPSIVAPGSVVSTVPLHDGKQYWLSEGTSMAAPHVSGALALLLEVVQRNNLNVSPVEVKRAVEMGAREIPGYTAAEQGYGALNLTMSWAELLSVPKDSKIAAETWNPGSGEGAGPLFRENVPQKLTLSMRNETDKLRSLTLEGNSWIKPEQPTVNIPAGRTRSVDVDMSVPAEKGLYSAFIWGDDPATYGKDVEVLATVINPYELTADNSYSVTVDGTETAAQYKRYFFKAPAGAEAIKAKVSVPNGAGRAK